MKHSEGRFTGAGGRSIYYQCWEPQATPRAVLLLVHGAGEHSGRYRSLAQFFAGHNFAVAALDHNGHGYSEGVPGHVTKFEDYLHDLGVFHRQVVERFNGLPIVLIGHSMGGLIASLYLLRHQLEFVAAVLSGPAIKTDPEPGPLQMTLLRLLACITPRLRMLRLDAQGVSRDTTVVRDYVEDPLVFHGKMSARMLRELFAGMQAIQTGAAGITLPMLILHGGDDAMTAPEGSRFLYRHIGSSDKTLKIYPGLYHEIFNEPERAEVLADVLSWCETRLGKP
ncbi:MAG: lysophospholipase [Halioglobus sp.]|nr:lysophospholipase [Halioglobus sp.]